MTCEYMHVGVCCVQFSALQMYARLYLNHWNIPVETYNKVVNPVREDTKVLYMCYIINRGVRGPQFGPHDTF